MVNKESQTKVSNVIFFFVLTQKTRKINSNDSIMNVGQYPSLKPFQFILL